MTPFPIFPVNGLLSWIVPHAIIWVPENRILGVILNSCLSNTLTLNLLPNLTDFPTDYPLYLSKSLH